MRSHLARSVSVRVQRLSQAFFCAVQDPKVGQVRLSGRVSLGTADTLLVIVHGLGGSSQSGYVVALGNVASAMGWAVLRINQRGADMRGEDYYHAGLYQDLLAAIEHPDLCHFSRVMVVGFSLGGHTCLRLAAAPKSPRVKAVASVCAPLNLAISARHFDEHAGAVYRKHVLSSLAQLYTKVAERHQTPITVAEARRIRYIRDWDDRVVAPRHGFSSGAHYYQSVSAHQHLREIDVPTLVLHAAPDPMVDLSAVEPALAQASAYVHAVIRPRGGHLGFPGELDLGVPGSRVLEHQLLAWLSAHG